MKLTQFDFKTSFHRPSGLYKAMVSRVNEAGKTSRFAIGEGKTEKQANAQANKVIARLQKLVSVD